MSYATIRYGAADGVATITLARPEKLNAVTAGMHADLRDALAAAEADDAVRCLVITGDGRAFSSGQDLTESASPDPTARSTSAGGSTATTIRSPSGSTPTPR